MQNGRGRRGRAQWESNPGGDLWDPRRYEPTIAIHMDKLIQDGVPYIDDGTTIRNETPTSRQRQSDMNCRETVAMSFRRVRRSICSPHPPPPPYRFPSPSPRISTSHTSRKSLVSVLDAVAVRYECAWLFEELYYVDESRKNQQLAKVTCEECTLGRDKMNNKDVYVRDVDFPSIIESKISDESRVCVKMQLRS